MAGFARADLSSGKPDKKGKIVVKVFLLDESKKGGQFPVVWNRKEEVALDDTTVGAVWDFINKALFGNEG